VREQCGPQLRLEGLRVPGKCGFGAHRRRIQETEDRFRCPVVRLDEGVAGDLDESGLAQYRCVVVGSVRGPGCPGFLRVLRKAPRPSAHHVDDSPLPGLALAEDAVAAKNRQAASRLEPKQGLPRNDGLVQPVEGVPDRDQRVCPRRGVKVLGPSRGPGDVCHSFSCRLPPAGVNHLGLEVDRMHLAEAGGQRKGHAPGPARQVEKAALSRDSRTLDEIVQEDFRVRDPVPNVIGGRTGKGVRRAIRLRGFRVHDSLDGSRMPGASYGVPPDGGSRRP
jgi:hypothetical protein